MSRSTASSNPFIQAWETKPPEITLETLPQLFAHHRAQFGAATMTQGTPEGGAGGQGAGSGTGQGAGQGAGQQTGAGGGAGGAAGQGAGGSGTGQQPPERPEGVTEAEWASLGDPGRVAISRERDARQAAERALAAARARPTPPAPTGGGQGSGDQGQQNAGQGAGQGGQQQNAGQGAGKEGQVDVGAIVQQAVTAALKPFQEREEQRDADAAVQRIQTSVMDAAKDTFLDPTDALTGIDLTQVTDGTGNADPVKIDTQLKDLLVRKPHLAKSPDGRRYAAAGSGAGAGGAGPNLETKVQETLSRMQAAAGIKQTTNT